MQPQRSSGSFQRQRSSGSAHSRTPKNGGQQEKPEVRIESSATGIGLRDWCFGASLLVKDCIDELEPDCPSLQRMLEAIYCAAAALNNDNWRRFNELIWDRVHCQDHEVHGALIGKVEKTWRTFLNTPKGGATCVFLHIGTEPPSTPLCNLLTKMRWCGVIVGPVGPEPGNEDLVEYVRLDPGHERDRDECLALLGPSGGKVPKPAKFLLAFVNCVFNPMDPDPDSDEENLVFGTTREEEEEEEEQEQEEETADERRHVPSWERAKWVTTPPAGKEKRMLSTASAGFGRLGITTEPDVRKRLRTLNMCLNVALNRLKDTGTLIILWPALPCHPVMFFLTASLRPLFARVHVVANDGIKTFESYIVCSDYRLKKASEAAPGEGGSALNSFMACAYRRPALDDVLLWTLPQPKEVEEALFGANGASLVNTYDQLWDTFAQKYKALAADLDLDVTRIKAARAKKERAKKEEESKPEKPDKTAKPAKPKAKADGGKKDAGRKSSDKDPGRKSSDKDPGRKGSDAGRRGSGDAGGASAQGKSQASPKPSKDEAKSQSTPTGTEAGMGVAERLARAAEEEARALEAKRRKKRNQLRYSASAPTLSCSFGAAPGRGGAPDRFKMCGEFDMIKFGHLAVEKRIDVRKFYRKRDDVGVSLAGDGVTASPRNEAEELPLPIGSTLPNWGGPSLP